MTRKQVAQRLGKNVVTVRRLEGRLLRPVRDGRGVHHFDPDEVEKLARDIGEGRLSLLHELRASTIDPIATKGGNDCENCSVFAK